MSLQQGKEEKLPRLSMYIHNKFEKLDILSICIVLNKAIEKLRIVQQLLPNPEVNWNEIYQAVPTRMTTVQKVKPPEDVDPENIQDLKHIQKCRYMSQNAFEKVILEVKTESEEILQFLKYVVFTENLKYFDNFLLKQENINLNNTICSLKDKINEVKKNSQETRLYLNKMTQSCLEQASVTTWVQSETRKRNTEIAQQARTDQNSYKLKEKEDDIITIKEKYISEISKEDLINSEITSHLQMLTLNLQKQFEKWTVRYSEEVDNLDITLLQLRSKMDEQNEKFVTMSEHYTARQELVNILQEEADKRDREIEIRLAKTKAVIIIQQWWRKILFMRLVFQKKVVKGGGKKNKKEPLKKKKKK